MSFTNISLMKKLSKLMTGPLAHHKSPSPQKLRKRYYQDFQSVAPWNNRGSLQVSDYQLMKSLAMDQINDRNRSLRYIEFEQMEFMPEIASALDIYADEMTASTSQRPCVIVKSRFPEVQEVLNVLFYDILRVENNLPGWARNMCKNGDFFLYLKLDDSLGVVNSIGLPAREIKRIEGIDPTNEDNYKYIWETTRREFEPFEIAHFRAMTDDRYYPYGVSVLEGARRIHRQLCMRGSTKVWTPTGYTELQSLQPGDEIYSYDPDTDSMVVAHVKHSMCMGEDEVFRVKTANGSVYATKDHPLMKAGGAYKTVGIWDMDADRVVVPYVPIHTAEIPDLKVFPDDQIRAVLSPSGRQIAKERVATRKESIRHLADGMSVTEYGNKYNTWFNTTQRSLPLKEAQEVCRCVGIPEENLILRTPTGYGRNMIDLNMLRKEWSAFVRFLGFWIGDGWYDETNESVCFSMGIDPEMMQPYLRLFDALGVRYSVRNSRKDEPSSSQCNVFSKHLLLIMKKLGFRTGSRVKRVPKWVFSQTDEIRREFVWGYIDADGCDTKDGSMQYGTVNKNLAEDFRMLLWQVGFVPTNISTTPSMEKVIRGKATKTSEVYTVKFRDRATQHAMQNTVNTKKMNVLSIEYVGTEVVYDIETDHPTHNFIAENIVVSNCMQEDAMMSYRITRAPERLQVIIDTTGIPDDDREAYVQDFITGFRRNEVIDESTGMKNLRYKPMAIDENYFLTISDHNDKTRIETLKGGEYVGVIDDVKYLRAKLFAALKIPEEYLSLGEGKSADQGSLTQKDIRFARTVQRLQRHIVEELTRIAVIHLITLGFDNAELLDFSISLANPSVMAELQEFEHFKTKCGIIEAAGYKAKYLLGLPWLSSNILGLSADEHRQQQREVETSIRWIAKADALAEGADNEGGPAGDALGGAADAALEGAAAGGGEGGGLEGGEPAEDEPDSMLLTAPARRDVKTTQRDIIGIMQQRRAADSGVTPAAASNNYTPYQKKGENADMRPLGARQRSKAARAGEQSVSATKRNIRQGLMTEDSIVNQDGDDE